MTSVIEGFRLSPQQKRLWALQRGGHAYLSQCVVAVEGELGADALRAALRRVVARHEILRTSFHCPPGMSVPIQVVAETAEPALEVVDPGGEAGEREGLVAETLRAEAARDFDLETLPPLRATLLRFSPREHALLLTLPSLCADGRALVNLVGDLARCYGSGGADDADEPTQYVQFSEWQNELLEENGGQGEGYWRTVSAAAAPALALPYEKTGGAPGRAFAPVSYAWEFAPEVAAKLGEACDASGDTPGAFLLTCLTTLMWRLSGQSDFALGVDFDNRNYEELEDALGLLARCVPLRPRPEGGETFARTLERVAAGLREAGAWQEFFSWEGSPAEDAGGPPFLPVCFAYEEIAEGHEAGGVRFTVSRLTGYAERFKLRLACRRQGGRLGAEWQYDPDAFADEDVRLIARCFDSLLRSALRDGRARGSELEVLGESDRERLLAGFNRTAADYPRDKCIHQLFEERAARAPGETAVVAGARQMTYGQLNAAANRLAHFLRRRGVGPDVPVGLCVGRSVEMVAALLGILKAGGAYMPFEPDHPEARLVRQLTEARAPVLVTERAFAARFGDFAGETVYADAEFASLAGEPADDPAPLASPGNLAYVLHTSGSTGTPKGVCVTHQNLVNYTHFICGELGLANRAPLHFATVTTVSADLGNTCIFPALASGGCLHVLDNEVAADGERFAAHLAEHPLDVLKIVPSHLSALLESLKFRGTFVREFLILGGEPLSADLVRRIREVSGGCRLINHYGPTETTVGSLTCRVEGDATGAGRAARVPIGRPIANTRVYVLNESLRPVPVGVAGELYVGGEGVSRGYLRRPGATAERFLPNPFSTEPGARLYRTGDLARHTPEGLVEFVGRNDHQVKIRGFRVEPGEIEAALHEHAAVREALVLALEDEAGQKRLVAYSVAGGDAPTAGDLRTFLRRRLPEHMIPSSFVTLKALPRTPNGKVNLRELPEPARDGDGGRAEYVAARGHAEELLANIWGEVLGVERVGMYDNFFELGGDSILSIQIVARANRAGLGLTPKQLFDHPTVAELAAVVASHPAAAPAEQEAVQGEAPLTPIQHWFFERELPRPHHFNQAVLLRAEEALDASALREVVGALVAHHDALRLRFEREARGWRQTHADAVGDVPFVHLDLSALAESSRPAAVERAADSLQQSLDLKDGPLLRVAYFDFGAGRAGRLLLAVHHLTVDGVSWRILLEDLQAAYAQAVRGERISLPAKTTSFKEWAERLARHAQGEEVSGEAAYWLAVKSDDSAPLPLDTAGAADTVGSSRTLTASLTEEETRALLVEVPEVYHTQVNDLLLTALAQAFADWTGSRRLLVDLEGHGRESVVEGADVTRTVGWFTTHYPVALDLGRAADPGEALGRVKEQLRAVPNNGIGYGLLRYLSDDRETARRLRALRAPEVSFNYLGRFDRVLEESSAFGPADESAGRAHDDGEPVSHLLRFNASVMAGRLRVSLTYGENAHRRETAARLADGYVAALRALIAHCRERRPVGYAPSDFPLAGVSRRDLGLVLRQLGDAQAGGLEDLYPLTPMQEGMLFESLSDPASDPYFRQYRFSLHGSLDAQAFGRAWQEVVNRHAALRTSFCWEGLERPLQAVRRQVALPLEQQDWRGLPPGEQARRLEALHAAEQRRGLDPARAPLMRLVLVRVDDDVHQFIWSYHHLLMDGWSRSLIHREVLTLYEAYAEGRDAELEARRPYRDYVEWLGREAAARDEGFWRERLRGFTRPNSLAGVAAPADVSAAPGEEGVLRSQLSAAETDELLAATRRHRLTPNTLVQGAWAIILGRLSGDTDVVYGTVVSGRPSELAGSEAMMGLFINTLPVRVHVRPEESVLSWLERLQAELAALREYEHSPLAQVQRWSGVPAGRPLFETTVSFGNFWVDAALHERRDGSLEMRDISFTERMHQAFVLGVMPGPAWTFQLLYDPRRFDGGAAATVLREVAALAKELISRPERRLGELLPSGGMPGGEDPQDAADARAEFVF